MEIRWVNSLIENETAFLLVLARTAAFVAAIPFIGSLAVPHRVRILVVLALTFVLAPVVRISTYPGDPAALGVGLLSEGLIGLAMGLGVRVIFAAVEVGAEMVGLQMGMGIANVFDPVSSRQISLIGRFYGMITALIFFLMDGHHAILRALLRSFDWIPFMGFSPSVTLMDQVVRLGGAVFELGVRVGMPVMAALLLTNLGIGILTRVVPQINALLFSFPVTIGIGLLIIGASLSLFMGWMQAQMAGLEGTLNGLLSGMRGG